MEADLRATVQFIASTDLDTQTKLWGWRLTFRATVQFIASTDLDTQTKLWGWRLTLGLQLNSSHPQTWTPRLNCGDGG
jgi:hypothetical protein